MSAAKQKSAGSGAIIEIRNLHTRYGKAVVHENASLSVQPGEIFSLVGASGCGKSTLLRAILMLLEWQTRDLGPRSWSAQRRPGRRQGVEQRA